MKFLNKILGINIPTVDKIKSDVSQQQLEQPPIGYITFMLNNDGTVSINTEWIEENKLIATIYAQMLYHINAGGLEDGIISVLLQYGSENVQSQEFISTIIGTLNMCKQKYKNLPLITPSQALRVKEG